MSFEKVMAWVFLISTIVSLWALVYLAVKVSRLLRELRLTLPGIVVGLNVAGRREERADKTLGKVVAAVADAKVAAQAVADKAVVSVEEIKQVVRDELKSGKESHF